MVRHIAHHPIRTRGTFCGSIAHADPASEWCAVAAALDAEMVAESKVSGTRIIPAREFFEGIMTTALREDELLREVRLPILPKGTYAGFAEYSRRAGDYAIAMAVATYRLKNGVMSDMRIAVGGAEAAPRRIAEAERDADRPPAEPRHVPGGGACGAQGRRSARRSERQRRLPARHRARHGLPRAGERA